MGAFFRALFEPGFFASTPVHVALAAGGVVAVVSGVLGVFTVSRGQSYAGHAFSDISVTGGSGSFLVGISPLWGFVGTSVVAAGIMDLIGIRKPRGRDLATGIVRGAGLGLAALFLYWDTTHTSTTGATITILFGSLFTISTSLVPVIAGLSVVALGVAAVLYRPLLLSTVSADLAFARGVPVRLAGVACLVAVAVAVSLSAMTIGAILSTALLVGPAAIAFRLTSRPGLAMLWSAVIAVVVTWLGVVLAYDSYSWPPVRHGWPVSFFVVTLIFLGYLAAQLISPRRRTAAGLAALATGTG